MLLGRRRHSNYSCGSYGQLVFNLQLDSKRTIPLQTSFQRLPLLFPLDVSPDRFQTLLRINLVFQRIFEKMLNLFK